VVNKLFGNLMESSADLEKLIADLQRKIKLIRIRIKKTASKDKQFTLKKLTHALKKEISILIDQKLYLEVIDCNEATHHHKFH
jgi:predicted  nucleic acid-binding Zn-ribbon protein